MTLQRLRKVGDRFIVEIPADDLERRGFREGQTVAITVESPDDIDTMSPDLRQAFDESWERSEAAYRYLAGG